ncbi:lipopolysaccharide biosynthesis protein [Candidatus Latescibacterota bacterium]
MNRGATFLLGIISSLGVNGISIAINLVSIPIGLHYFGPVRYGIWLTLSSIIAYLNLSQLGIGTAIQTLIAKSVHPSHQRIILRRSLFLLTIISFTSLALFVMVSYYYPGWVSILGKIPLSHKSETSETALILAVLLLIGQPTKAFLSTFVALQEKHWERFYFALTTIFGLVALVITIYIKGGLLTLAMLRGLSNMTFGILSGFHLLYVHPDIRLWHGLRERVLGAPSVLFILKSSAYFFTSSIAAIIIWNTDNIVISHFLGPSMVTTYAITFKLFLVGTTFFTLVNNVLLPIYARAAGMKQFEWIQKTYISSIDISMIIGGLIWVGGLAFAQDIINVWVGPTVNGSVLLIIALGGYCYSLCICNTHFIILSSINAMKNVVIISWFEAATNIGISIALIGHLGISGVALGTFFAPLISSFWLLPIDIAFQTKGKVRFKYRQITSHMVLVLFPALVVVYILNIKGPYGWSGICIKAVVIIIYLGCSWCIIPRDQRRFIRNKIREHLIRNKTNSF